jgi:hypothetical protein
MQKAAEQSAAFFGVQALSQMAQFECEVSVKQSGLQMF